MAPTGEEATAPPRASAAVPSGLAPFAGAVVAVVAAVFDLSLLAVMERAGVPVAVLLRDPAAQLGFWPFYGFLSHLGVALMAAAGIVCVFVASCGSRERALFGAVGALSLVLATDDFLMLHEHFFPNRGIPEKAVFAAYALCGLAIVAIHWRALFDRRAAAFWLAGALLGGSVMVDLIQTRWDEYLVLEDSLKFCGIAVWSAFWIGRAGAAVRAREAGGGR